MRSHSTATRLAMRRSQLLRHYGADSPQVVAADLAWRRAKVAEAVERYGSTRDSVVMSYLLGDA